MDSFSHMFSDKLAYHAGIAVLIVAAFVLLAGFVKRLVVWIGRKIVSRTETTLDDMILDVIRKNVRLVWVVIGLHVAVREIRKGITGADETSTQLLDYVSSILYVVLVIVLVRIFLGMVRVSIDWYLDRLNDDKASHLKTTLGPLSSKIVNLLVGMVAFIIVLDHFGINIGSLLVSLGVGSLAVALAAQDTLANMIAGFVILVDRPFGVGDRIELPTGQVGDVQRIGLRSTQILNFDNNMIVMPNAELVKGRITNYSYPATPMRVVLRFELAHGTDPERVRVLLLQLAAQHPDVLSDPPPRVYLTALSDVSVQMTLVCRCSSFQKQFDLEVLLREQAYAALQLQGVSFAIPQRILHMKTEA